MGVPASYDNGYKNQIIEITDAIFSYGLAIVT